MKEFAVILAAAGRSTRFADPYKKKVFANVQGRPVWMFSAEVFSKRSDVGQIILVIAPEDKEHFNEKHAGSAAMLGIETVFGGAERADSVQNALRVVRDEFPWVAIHDAARPCLANVWVDAVFAQARRSGAAILAIPCSSTIKRVAPATREVVETVPREGLWLAQTPQVFRTQWLRDAYEGQSDTSSATDEASLVERSGHQVSVVEGSLLNVKVTTQADIKFVEHALKAMPARSNPFPF